MNVKLTIHNIEIESLVSAIHLDYKARLINVTLDNGCVINAIGDTLFDKLYRALLYPDSGYIKIHTKCVDHYHEGTIRARVHPVEFRCPECGGDVWVESCKIID